ncbi:hypothetical protein NKG94_32630 [Micromonospora sp. M12]
MPALTVGFDLDMTLVDSRPGIAAAYRALTERTGVPVDAELAVSRLGPPCVPRSRTGSRRSRSSRPFVCTASCTRRTRSPHAPLPGAREAIEAIRARVAVCWSSRPRSVGWPVCTWTTSVSRSTSWPVTCSPSRRRPPCGSTAPPTTSETMSRTWWRRQRPGCPASVWRPARAPG